ncbi:hypothetical protein AAMO2058_001624100 [Amorphochlora amoebiformis]
MADTKSPDKRTPVTILSGFLGSGKTTLMKHLLENTHKLKIAMIVNDMAELNIDAALVRRKGAEISKTQGEDGKMVELDNGCICCSLRPNMVKEISRLTKMSRFDYIVIESSGICEPMPIAEAFFEENEDDTTEGGNLTTGQAMGILNEMASLQSLIEHYGKEKINEGEDGKRSIAELLVDQVEFANVILVNKTDLITKDISQPKDALSKIRGVIKALNPSAEIMETSYSKIDTSKVLSTGLFDLDNSKLSAGWAQALNQGAESKSDEKKPVKTTTKSTNMGSTSTHKGHGDGHGHGHGHGHGQGHGHAHRRRTLQAHKHGDHYGITSFVYRRRRPFHPVRLYELLGDKKGIKTSLRSKGFCWIASRHDTLIEWNMAGKICTLESGGGWYVDDPDLKEELKDEPEILAKILADFQEPWGDRRIELVIIGVDMDQKAIERALDECLLSEKEVKAGSKEWAKYEDKFPKFPDEE